EELSKCEILVYREDLPVLSTDSYYWADLIGFDIKSEDGLSYGMLDSFIETGSNDVMVVIGSNDRKLIPFINNEVIKSVDLGSKVIIVDWDDEE
ncbi:MAG TPA: ribosome maturation factor RimM, partial [Gammaproteobacteria bacterium]|nr:ribosome maturation factor RimM [Gammaproteobacteria bacterium]